MECQFDIWHTHTFHTRTHTQTSYDVNAVEPQLPRPLIPSLSLLLSQQSNVSSNDCIGRYWHSSVHDPLFQQLWLFGGLDLQGVLCQGLVVVDTSSLVATETCEGCVWREAGGPSARYLHTAVATTVSSSIV